MDVGAASYTYSQKGKRLLTFEDHVYQLTKTYTKKSGDARQYWLCERRRDLGCTTSVTTDKDGKVVKGPTTAHIHAASVGRGEALAVRHAMLTESSRRPEAAPAILLNEFVTPSVVLKLASEPALKQAIQRRRRAHRPKDPDTASGIVITGDWSQTFDGKPWYLGAAVMGDDISFIFATEENLTKLAVSIINFHLFIHKIYSNEQKLKQLLCSDRKCRHTMPLCVIFWLELKANRVCIL